MFAKIMGFIFTIGGGILLGIALTSDLPFPLWWWILSLLFIIAGIVTIFADEIME